MTIFSVTDVGCNQPHMMLEQELGWRNENLSAPTSPQMFSRKWFLNFLLALSADLTII